MFIGIHCYSVGLYEYHFLMDMSEHDSDINWHFMKGQLGLFVVYSILDLKVFLP